MLKFVPKLPWLQHGYMSTSWGHVTWLFAPPPAEASEIVHQDALAYSEFSQGMG